MTQSTTQRIVPMDQLAGVLAAADRKAALANTAGENFFSMIACETGQGDVMVSTIGLRHMTRTELVCFTQPGEVALANRLLVRVFEQMGQDKLEFRDAFWFEGQRYALVPQVVLPQQLSGLLYIVIGTLQMLPPVFVEIVPLGQIGTGRSASQAARIGKMANTIEPQEATALELHLMLHEATSAVDDVLEEAEVLAARNPLHPPTSSRH